MSLLPSRFFAEPADPHALVTEPPPRGDSLPGVLFVNLGTPDEPEPAAIRR